MCGSRLEVRKSMIRPAQRAASYTDASLCIEGYSELILVGGGVGCVVVKLRCFLRAEKGGPDFSAM